MEELSTKSGRFDKAIMALLSSPTVTDAAKESGIPQTTLYRYLQDEEFQELYRQARSQAVGQTVSYVQSLCSSAIETLKSIMLDENGPKNARVSAARVILETSLRCVEADELMARLEKLERRDENA